MKRTLATKPKLQSTPKQKRDRSAPKPARRDPEPAPKRRRGKTPEELIEAAANVFRRNPFRAYASKTLAREISTMAKRLVPLMEADERFEWFTDEKRPEIRRWRFREHEELERMREHRRIMAETERILEGLDRTTDWGPAESELIFKPEKSPWAS